jgi:hypothetical protein
MTEDFSTSLCRSIHARLMNSNSVGLDVGTTFQISAGVKNADSKVVLPSKRIASEAQNEPQVLKKSSRLNMSDPFNQIEQTPQFNLLENGVTTQPEKGPSGCKHNCKGKASVMCSNSQINLLASTDAARALKFILPKINQLKCFKPFALNLSSCRSPQSRDCQAKIFTRTRPIFKSILSVQASHKKAIMLFGQPMLVDPSPPSSSGTQEPDPLLDLNGDMDAIELNSLVNHILHDREE